MTQHTDRYNDRRRISPKRATSRSRNGIPMLSTALDAVALAVLVPHVVSSVKDVLHRRTKLLIVSFDKKIRCANKECELSCRHTMSAETEVPKIIKTLETNQGHACVDIDNISSQDCARLLNSIGNSIIQDIVAFRQTKKHTYRIVLISDSLSTQDKHKYIEGINLALGAARSGDLVSLRVNNIA